jgi:N-acetyl-gamma-glutamyl-phosphate reductase
MIKTAIVGGAGYAGIELVRCLLRHPGFEVVAVTSDIDAGKLLAELYPAFVGQTNLVFSEHHSVNAISDLDAVFLAVPHTAAMTVAPGFLARGINVFDLSADFRLKDPVVYEQWYGVTHTAPELLDVAIYGLPELNRSLLLQKHQELIKGFSPTTKPVLVACPGCYPTASALAAAPVLVADLAADETIVVNAISGVSGAGRTPTQAKQFCSVNENVYAYGVAGHRHTPEIAQTFSWEALRQVPVVFTPHLAPFTRGLLATVTVKLKSDADASALESIYTKAYAREPFVQLLPYGVMPQTASVAGTNNAQVGIKVDEATGTLIACCAIDNLGKGAASQAVQCANIVFGFGETLGLAVIAEVP